VHNESLSRYLFKRRQKARGRAGQKESEVSRCEETVSLSRKWEKKIGLKYPDSESGRRTRSKSSLKPKKKKTKLEEGIQGMRLKGAEE